MGAFAFALQKLDELKVLAHAPNDGRESSKRRSMRTRLRDPEPSFVAARAQPGGQGSGGVVSMQHRPSLPAPTRNGVPRSSRPC